MRTVNFRLEAVQGIVGRQVIDRYAAVKTAALVVACLKGCIFAAFRFDRDHTVLHIDFQKGGVYGVRQIEIVFHIIPCALQQQGFVVHLVILAAGESIGVALHNAAAAETVGVGEILNRR